MSSVCRKVYLKTCNYVAYAALAIFSQTNKQAWYTKSGSAK